MIGNEYLLERIEELEKQNLKFRNELDEIMYNYRALIHNNEQKIDRAKKVIDMQFIKSFVNYCGFTFDDVFLKSQKRKKVAIISVLIQHYKDKGYRLHIIGKYFKLTHATIISHLKKEAKYDKILNEYNEKLIEFKEIESGR